MRVRLILENGGHAITKRLHLSEVPAVGSFLLAERARMVVSVEIHAERGEADVYLREDADDLLMQVIPEAHLAHIELMKRYGWDVEEEAALRAWLMLRIDRQDEDEPADQN
ncbi:hypothetical protein WME75_31705 [Sorangium sp. So ce1014]|uniref:hypothetical protein n=1 Tax=Sorangium sp. So ce1014 TaxID=3133326 RepID=UPI003F616D73